MSMTPSGDAGGITPNAAEVMLAKETSRRLAAIVGGQSTYQIQLVDKEHRSELLTIPAAAMQLLVEALAAIANGDSVMLLPAHAELSTQQAADMLHVSRPYLIGLLEKGEMPFHKVGTHRRLHLKDVLAYKQQVYAARLEALDSLAEQAQRLNMGY